MCECDDIYLWWKFFGKMVIMVMVVGFVMCFFMVFVDELLCMVIVGEGLFYFDKLLLDMDNDLLFVNELMDVVLGIVIYLMG